MRFRRGHLIAMLAVSLGALAAIPVLADKPGKLFKSPLKNFDVPVPKLGMFGGDTIVRKRNSKDEGTVSFTGDTGDTRRIDYVRLPPEAAALSGEEQQAGYERMLKGIIESNPQSLIVTQKPYELDGVRMLLAIVSFPGGSHLMDQRTQKHLDSTRGLLFFARSSFLYVLHDEVHGGAFDIGKEPPDAEELTRRAERSLPEFYRTITFK